MTDYLALLAGMGLVTYLPRWMPLHLLSRRSLPDWFIQWLDLIPAAILSALLLPVLVLGEAPRHIDLLRPELWVALPTFAFAWWTRSLGGTVVVGMLLFWLAGKLNPLWLAWLG
jgi:branched-subunit amino acid transport protein